MTYLSYLAVLVILLAYFKGSQRAFDWANVFCNIPLFYVAYTNAVYGSAAISLAFGLIGLYHIVRRNIWKI